MDNKSQVERKPKKTYHPPELSFYGDITEITRGANSNGSDGGGGSGSHSKNCWIAEALYGVDAPRTHLVRSWLRECYQARERWALIAVPMYSRFGQQVAKLVRSYRVAQRLFRPLFDHAVNCAHREYAARIADRAA